MNIKTVKIKKTKLITIVLYFISLCTTAQIISVEEHGLDYVGKKNLVKEGVTYVKDINNVLNKYVGTWSGESDGKKITFYIEKYTEINDTGDLPIIKFDRLIIKHTTKVNNIIIDDTTALDDEDPLVISGYYLSSKGNYVLNYIAKENDCGQNGRLFIHINDSNTNLKCLLIRKSEFVSPDVCDVVDVNKYMPKSIELIKQ